MYRPALFPTSMHTIQHTQIDLLRFSKFYIKRKIPCDDDWVVQYVWGMIGKEGDNCERFFILLMFVQARGNSKHSTMGSK